jgi:hypothetical protein
VRVGRTLIIGGVALYAEDVVQIRGHTRMSGTSRWRQTKASSTRKRDGGEFIWSGFISHHPKRVSGILNLSRGVSCGD